MAHRDTLRSGSPRPQYPSPAFSSPSSYRYEPHTKLLDLNGSLEIDVYEYEHVPNHVIYSMVLGKSSSSNNVRRWECSMVSVSEFVLAATDCPADV